VIIAVGNNDQFRRFCEAGACPELFTDTRFLRVQDRIVNREQLIPLMAKVVPGAPSSSGSTRSRRPACPAARSTTWPRFSRTRRCRRAVCASTSSARTAVR
jgi:crotonobetainyl-CoA:carnitine CoA-transferase CaiB-like acyl-CoA transferase